LTIASPTRAEILFRLVAGRRLGTPSDADLEAAAALPARPC
jgi:hypothetical protein